MREKNLVKQIYEFVNSNNIKEFKASDLPFLKKSLGFLAKHRVGNSGGYTEYFIRTSRGLYKLKNTKHNTLYML